MIEARGFASFWRSCAAGAPNELIAADHDNARPSWPEAMRTWGALSNIQYVGPIGTPQWRRYGVKAKTPTARQTKTVPIRWEMYRVVHDKNAALWKPA